MSNSLAHLYDAEFYQSQRGGSHSSAQEIVPLILDLLSVKSVCDVGCGEGTWLRVFRAHKVVDIVGIDGDYVAKDRLQIPDASFQSMDLRKRISLERSFDLAVSLEVAEHLPESRAASFVEDLTRLAPIVLFSAAIPGQGGTGHVNEQWHSYWIALFSRYDYQLCDALRPKIWNRRDRIASWYRHNIMLFCSRSVLKELPRLAFSPHSIPIAIRLLVVVSVARRAARRRLEVWRRYLGRDPA
jgi:trans-aconitate methyltransferase